MLSLASGGIFTDGLSSAISGATLTQWNSATGSITPMIAPLGGHGDDDIEELGGHLLWFKESLNQRCEVTQVNDFRRVGIVKTNCKW